MQLKDVDWQAVAYPLACAKGETILQVDYGQPASGASVAVVLATCSHGAGSPPTGLYVFDRATSTTAPHLLVTLAQGHTPEVASFRLVGPVLTATAETYPSSGPFCCATGTTTLQWKWANGTFTLIH